MNINDMSKEQLMAEVKNLDEQRAQKIVDFCKQKGGIKNLDELKTGGIDTNTIKDLRNAHITAEEEEEQQPV